MFLLWIAITIIVFLALAYHHVNLKMWTLGIGIWLYVITFLSNLPTVIAILFWILFFGILLPSNIYSLRRRYVSAYLFPFFRRVIPKMSRTESEALSAGGLGWEKELFIGEPNWQELLNQAKPTLSIREQEFLQGPVEELCNMIDDWEITQNLLDMPPKIWKFIKEKGFLGMIIPKEYGGLEFSEVGHSAVLIKVYSRSVTVASTISVPNSLGPAELLLKYGTDEQKAYYLPRLAKGEEIPCFALTGPTAGSDAAAIPDTGIICRGHFDGHEMVGIRLNWNKRYITLAPVATLVGLAFRLFDPEHLLSDVEDIGITCALVPYDLAGIRIGRRHWPASTALMNGPTQGENVFIPLEYIIGGAKMAGQGWRMLMECLSVGRAISLPSSAVGGAKAVAALTGAYARIRKQFNIPLGYFEGIEEPLARIVGRTYMIDAVLRFTAALIDSGKKSAIASAIVKYHTTENNRKIVNDAMDIHGGKGICLGPKNYLNPAYQSTTIGITVEGANILTRSLIIFGQGAIRCHPHVLKVIQAVQQEDMKQFDDAIFAHLRYTISRKARAFWLALTMGFFVKAPKTSVKRYYQWFSCYSAAFAFVSEFAMIAMGAHLKRREKISARLGDILSYLYLGSAVLKRFYDDDELKEDLPIVQWVCQELLYETQQAFVAVISNFPNRYLAWGLRFIVFPFGKRHVPPSDALGQRVAKILLSPSDTRQRLIEGIHENSANNPIAILEEALARVIAADELEKQLAQLEEANDPRFSLTEKIAKAIHDKLITRAESELILAAVEARDGVIAVDDFSEKELKGA